MFRRDHACQAFCANFVADPNYVQQAFATSEPFFARQAGIETRMLMTSDAGYKPYRVMFTRRDYLEAHPEVVGKFVNASPRGCRNTCTIRQRPTPPL